MNRGEIWTAAGGVYASKPRPAVIIQDDRFEHTDSLVVIPMTSLEYAAPLARVAVAADEVSGLDLPSWIMVDKISAVHRRNVTHRIGRLSTRQLVELERVLLVFLGIAD